MLSSEIQVVVYSDWSTFITASNGRRGGLQELTLETKEELDYLIEQLTRARAEADR